MINFLGKAFPVTCPEMSRLLLVFPQMSQITADEEPATFQKAVA
jgi:hypothetical protein